jgi:hypothetical protein
VLVRAVWLVSARHEHIDDRKDRVIGSHVVRSMALGAVAASMIAATGRYASRRSGCSLSSGLTNVSRTTT